MRGYEGLGFLIGALLGLLVATIGIALLVLANALFLKLCSLVARYQRRRFASDMGLLAVERELFP